MTILLNKCYQVKLLTRWCQHGKEIVNVICERPLTMFVCTHFGEKKIIFTSSLGGHSYTMLTVRGEGGQKRPKICQRQRHICQLGGRGVKNGRKFVNAVCEQPLRHWY